MVFIVPSSAMPRTESFELMLMAVVFATRTFSMLVALRKAVSMFFILLPPPVSTMPQMSLSAYSAGMR